MIVKTTADVRAHSTFSYHGSAASFLILSGGLMHRNLSLAWSIFAVACTPIRPEVDASPASALATCSKDSAAIAYFVDGQSVTCASVMTLPKHSIASVEVLKGRAAAAQYGASAAAGVVVIQTKKTP